MSADAVDLSTDFYGRPTARRATTPTPFTFGVTGMTPWQVGDQIEMGSPESGLAAYEMQDSASAGVPMAGDTNLSGFIYDLSLAAHAALPDASAGDQLLVTHLAMQTDGTHPYQTITETFAPTPFTVGNGGSATLTGAFTAAAAGASLAVTWDRPAFASELAARWPGANTKNWSTLAITALPEAAMRGFYGDGPDVVVFAPGYQTDSSALTTSWPYADPYPAEWTRIAWVRFYKYRYVQLPGASPVAIFARMRAYRDLSTVTAQAPIEPLVGAVMNPTIAGMPALGTTLLSGVGMTPTIAWSEPTLGTANRYYVQVDLLQVQNGVTTLQPFAIVETSDTHVRIPSGILITGQTYVFEIEARAAPGVDIAATPAARVLPDGYASITTTMATP